MTTLFNLAGSCVTPGMITPPCVVSPGAWLGSGLPKVHANTQSRLNDFDPFNSPYRSALVLQLVAGIWPGWCRVSWVNVVTCLFAPKTSHAFWDRCLVALHFCPLLLEGRSTFWIGFCEEPIFIFVGLFIYLFVCLFVPRTVWRTLPFWCCGSPPYFVRHSL